jgi:hypothetical protein
MIGLKPLDKNKKTVEFDRHTMNMMQINTATFSIWTNDR